MLKPKKVSRKGSRASLITYDVAVMADVTGNVYESVAIISKRARQIAMNIKEELNQKISEFASTHDNLEEIHENREQIEISKHYERLPKPTTIAVEEFLDGKIVYKYPDPEDDQMDDYID